MPGIRRLAIANRGEAAIRVLAAVAELNGQRGDQPPITTIALYTEPDANAWYVSQADEAICLGPATYTDPVTGRRTSSYLDGPRVVGLLCEAAADAVWVGWGFVSESAAFANLCEQSGIVFIGPQSATIRSLGDKIAAKRLAQRLGIPVVPWSGGPLRDTVHAAREAARLGYPVILKAAAGGGGRGIRTVREESELAAAYAGAKAEAQQFFGDAAVFAEHLQPAARHVEVQIIADGHGTTWALGVRDCTIQRRRQKVIEESASTVLTPESEQALRDAAIRLASVAEYRGAGTVEFLVDPATGAFSFMEVNTRLQVEHPVTEATTGVDLVKLQLHIAAGGRLTGTPPPVRGHAVEARLCAEDPENGFAPAPGRLLVLRLPSGAGIRVDSGVREGDVVAPEFDSMIAKIIAYGRDRAEAISRLHHALSQTTAVVEGGTSNRSFLLTVLDRAEVRAGRFDNHWLDRLTAERQHIPPADPVALLVAATEAYEADHAAERAAFHARAARGRAESPAEIGHACVLRYRGELYRLRVYRTAPRTYRIVSGGTPADIEVEAITPYERRVNVGGRRHRVVSVVDGQTFRVDVDGAAHTLVRDDGGIVRCGWPAYVVSVLVASGDTVAEGQPLLVLESMKMETAVAAPYAGVVTDLAVATNTQVDAGAPLLRIRPGGASGPADSARQPVDLGGLAGAEPHDVVPCEYVYAALRAYLLGYDLDASTLADLLTRRRELAREVPPEHPVLLQCEDDLVDLFMEVGALYRARTEPEPGDEEKADTPQEYLLSYIQWLDADRAGLPDHYRRRLAHTLRRYGVTGLSRSPLVEDAVVWMFRSFRRLDDFAPVVAGILERRLRHREQLTPKPDRASSTEVGARALLRERMDRLIAVARGRYSLVAHLAQDLRFQYLDEPLLSAVVEEEYASVEGHLATLRAAAAPPNREFLIDRMIRSPQPLRGMLLRQRLAVPDDRHFHEILLEIYTRRHYRTRELTGLGFSEYHGYTLCHADYDLADKHIHLITAYAPLAELPAVARALAEDLADSAGDRLAVVDLATWRDGPRPDVDTLTAEIADLLQDCQFGRPLWRLDVTVTSPDETGPEHTRTQHRTYRQPDEAEFVEERLYRNLHPMLAKRLGLWRLSNFELERLPSPEDVYLFHGVGHDNATDHRLFALAEVRDLTPAVDASGQVSYPRLELSGLHALSAMREAQIRFTERDRPAANRLVLYIRPPWSVPRKDWARMARAFAPLATGARLDKAELRVLIPDADVGYRDTVLHLEGIGRRHGMTISERPPDPHAIRPLTAYWQKVLRAQQLGAPYPYEIIRMLTPPPDALGRFPPGRFAEHDLDIGGGLVPVDRPPGQNVANIVVGLLTNDTAKVPAGMARIALLSDPTRGLGNLAEPECRRIIAGIDLAQRLRVPVEWFALSSGARIAMDSGTENMDWIAAVLRRLIDFTQAGGEVNIIVTGVNVGAQPYWNAEATMLMHTKGILVMTPASAMVLTGKHALDFSGGVSAEDNFGIGGFDRVMGPNGQGQYWAANLEEACDILLRHYEHAYVVPGERYPRRASTSDPTDRDIRLFPLPPDDELASVGQLFSAEHNHDRKKPFDIRSVLAAVTDTDSRPLERWTHWRGAESAVVWDAHIGGIPVCLLGLESRTLPRRGYVPADGPPSWTSGTLFPQSSRKVARAINAACGNRPLVVLANLSGFDGSPESMRRWQLEYGAEIGRAVTNFQGPIVFVVISRYHGGAFVVFSKQLNERVEIAALEGSYASVIGGAPAAATVFAREITKRTDADPRLRELRTCLAAAQPAEMGAMRAELARQTAQVRAENLGAVADAFDAIHNIQRAHQVGSVDRIIPACELRPYLVDALERGMAADLRAATVSSPAQTLGGCTRAEGH